MTPTPADAGGVRAALDLTEEALADPRLFGDVAQCPADELRYRDAVPSAGRQVDHRRLQPVAGGQPLVLGGQDPTGPMSRAHVEIAHMIRRFGRILDDIEVPDADDLLELRQLLYGLYAILRLHFAQEDEGYLSLADDTEVR